MKKLLSNPGFESIFALSLVAIIGLPPLVLAQDKNKDPEKIVSKRIEVRIKDGDTTINGKNIKDLKGKDRDEALSYLPDTDGAHFGFVDGDNKRHVIIKRKGKGDDKDVIIERHELNNGDIRFFSDNGVLVNDSLAKNIDVKIKRLGDPAIAFNYRGNWMNGSPEHTLLSSERLPVNYRRRNTQSFNYSNVDNEGISTNISYRVIDAPNAASAKTGKPDANILDLESIYLTPNFSTGNTILSFTLDSKATAEVTFKNSDNKVLWTDKAPNGKFTKAFALPLNGAYYLTVKQGSKSITKRIVKED
ncbi:T9SS type A sorting domain-containing protein [Mucilaginibacter roseus]|uniref:T9SS type A sorting domain-containing protein n=1 Tax=Mucilaginibacter roseus TaxID=1528868 RepID=A0ABS8U8W0_9SPHI|nr:T9SS type A sorting domain-containing protein [Mucilaginibacter roseus]MCD8742464.1 T9SS type A sorting domain-containing protein [Mucilaginibacter roseus]